MERAQVLTSGLKNQEDLYRLADNCDYETLNSRSNRGRCS